MADIGDIVDGIVLSVMPFGVFIGWDRNQSGLVHISEISEEYVKDINTVIKKGDKVKAKLLNIDENGKMSLSIKQAAEPKAETVHKKEKPAGGSARPDSYDWSARRDEGLSFEDKLSRFKLDSEEKMRDTKRRLANKRSGGYSRKGY